MKRWHFPQFDFTVYFTERLGEITNPGVRYKFLKDLSKDTESDALCHLDDKKDGAYILLLENKDRDFIGLVDTVSHEVYHAVGYLYEALEDDTQIQAVPEVPAYYQGYLTGEIIKALGYY